MPWYNGDYPPSYKNQPVLIRDKAVEIANALLSDGAEEGIAIATGLKQARKLIKKYKEKHLKPELMKTDDSEPKSDENNDYPNKGSAYSGSGSMQPGGEDGQEKIANHNDQQKTENHDTADKKIPANGGKSIDEATDPSKLSDI